MIESFKDKETAKIWRREFSKRVPKRIQVVGYRKLVMLHRSRDLNDLRVLSVNRLEALSGDRSEQQGEVTYMTILPNVTPGEILHEEFLKPMQITAYRLARDTGMPATRISQILKGRRRITADTALRLSAYFGNSSEFWMGIQDEYDLRVEQERLEDELQKIPRVRAATG